MTPVDYESGTLQPENSVWLTSESITPSSSPREEIKLKETCDPTKVSHPNEETSRPNSYIQFGPTSRSFDVSQLTVPFFDAQSVIPSSPTWLSGIDLFHRGQQGSGGFLGLKVITFDLSKHN